jgi:hypothetical protein
VIIVIIGFILLIQIIVIIGFINVIIMFL